MSHLQVSTRNQWVFSKTLFINQQHNSQKKVQKDKQRSTKHTYKNKDRITGTQLKISYPGSLLNSEETLETHILTRKGLLITL
jgi:hypothetical protein